MKWNSYTAVSEQVRSCSGSTLFYVVRITPIGRKIVSVSNGVIPNYEHDWLGWWDYEEKEGVPFPDCGSTWDSSAMKQWYFGPFPTMDEAVTAVVPERPAS